MSFCVSFRLNVLNEKIPTKDFFFYYARVSTGKNFTMEKVSLKMCLLENRILVFIYIVFTFFFSLFLFLFFFTIFISIIIIFFFF